MLWHKIQTNNNNNTALPTNWMKYFSGEFECFCSLANSLHCVQCKSTPSIRQMEWFFVHLWITGTQGIQHSIMVGFSGQISQYLFSFYLCESNMNWHTHWKLEAKTLSRLWMHEDSSLFVLKFIYPNANAMYNVHMYKFRSSICSATEHQINIIH